MINFSDTENVANLINIETLSLNSTLDIQKNLNKQILIFMKNFIGKIDINSNFTSNNTVFEYINKSNDALSNSNSNIKNLKNLISKLTKLSNNSSKNDFSNYNSEYYETLSSIYDNTTTIENFIKEISLVDISELLKDISSIQNEQLNNSSIISNEVLDSSYIENTLIISEFQKKVILPYTIKQLHTIMLKEKDTYSSIQEVIDKLFTKPIHKYKFSAIARFKEAYNLIIHKEHGSKLKATALASELFFNYNLHPAIITACNSLNELDIYLACLEDNTLNEFQFFDIKFEVPPSIKN